MKHGGLLAEILDRLAGFLEASARLRKKVKSAMTYPVIVICIAFAITTFLIVKVVPIFGEIFKDFGAKLPAPTQFLIDVSDFMRGEWYFLILGIGGTIFGIRTFLRSTRGKQLERSLETEAAGLRAADSQDLHVAFLRAPSRSSSAAACRFSKCSTSSAALPAITLSRQSIKGVSADVEKGDNLSVALSKKPIFPPMMLRMVAAGEATGKIDTMLEKMADFWDEEIEAMLDALTSLIEPLLDCVSRRDRRRHRDRDVPADLQAERSSFAEQKLGEAARRRGGAVARSALFSV